MYAYVGWHGRLDFFQSAYTRHRPAS